MCTPMLKTLLRPSTSLAHNSECSWCQMPHLTSLHCFSNSGPLSARWRHDDLFHTHWSLHPVLTSSDPQLWSAPSHQWRLHFNTIFSSRSSLTPVSRLAPHWRLFSIAETFNFLYGPYPKLVTSAVVYASFMESVMVNVALVVLS